MEAMEARAAATGPTNPGAGSPSAADAGSGVTTQPEATEAAAPVGGDHPVRWHRLVLRGFGPFRDGVEFRFPDGLSHWVAPNEAGKSTLLAGLVAVLFGLPGSTDPTRYGQARYRHWGGAGRFEGELEFTATDGNRYRVVRDFERHRVRLVRLEGERAVEEWSGTHNPAATRPAGGYEEALRRLIGVASRNLLLQIYCLEQPLPAPEGAGQRPGLAQEVQEMLAGARTRSPAGALAVLVDHIKRLTRATRDLGISSHNQRQDREIEQVEAQIRELEEALRRDRLAADDLEQVRLQLAELGRRRQELNEQLRSCRQRQDAWREWQRRVDRYRSRLERRMQMEQAAQQASRLQAEIAVLEREEANRWPGWGELGRGGEDDPLAALDRLRDLEGQIGTLRHQLDDARRKQRQEAARSLLAAWHRYRFLVQVREAVARLAGRVPRLAEAAANDLERLRDVPRQEVELQQQIAALEAELRARQEAFEAWQADAAAVAAAYADVQGWTPAVAAAAAEMVLLRAEEERRQAEAERRRAEVRQRRALGRRVGLVVGVLAGLVAAGIAGGWDLPGVLRAGLAVLMALAGGGLAWRLVVAGGPAGEPAGDAAFRQRVEDVRARLGAWADLPAGRLVELERRYREWQARRDELERRRSRLEARGPGEVEQRLAEVRARLESLHQWAEPFLGGRGLADLPRVLAWWEAVARLGREAEREGKALARRVWGSVPGGEDGPAGRVGPDGEEGSGSWRQLAVLVADPAGGVDPGEAAAARPAAAPSGSGETGLEALGAGPTGTPAGGDPVTGSAAGLVAWLEGWHPLFWDEPSAEAARWRRIADRAREWLDALESSWSGTGGPDPSAVPAWPPSVAEQLDRIQADGEQEALAASRRADRLAQDLDALQAEADALRRCWRVLLDPFAGDAVRAREGWLEYLRHQGLRRGKAKELEGLLSAWEVADVAALMARAAQERDTALLDLKAIEELAEHHPELETQNLDPELAREALVRLESAAANLAAELQKVEESYLDLSSRERTYLQQEPINIAQAELELEALRRRREVLQEDLEALLLAYRDLDAAIREYHTSYRERLEASASRYFSRLTGRPGRRVVLDPGFRVEVREPDGIPVVPEQLSQGTRDQLYWSLRVAVADLLAGDVNIPFVLDDPFVHWDDHRIAEARQIVSALARDRQVIFLSHRTALAGWGQGIVVTEAPAAAGDGRTVTGAGPGGGSR